MILESPIGHIPPGLPRVNGKVERSHRTDGEEFYRFMLSTGYGRHLDMRITLGGKLLGIDPC